MLKNSDVARNLQVSKPHHVPRLAAFRSIGCAGILLLAQDPRVPGEYQLPMLACETSCTTLANQHEVALCAHI